MLSFLPNRGVRSANYLPPIAEVPQGDVYAIAFGFPATGALGTADQSESVHRAMLITHLVANTTAFSGSFLVQIYHQHGSEQRQWFPKPMQMELVAGTALNPLLLASPYYVAAGDSITVEISNVGKDNAGNYAQADIQFVMWGVML